MQLAVVFGTRILSPMDVAKLLAVHDFWLLHPLMVTCWSLTKAATFRLLEASRVNSRTMVEDGVSGRIFDNSAS